MTNIPAACDGTGVLLQFYGGGASGSNGVVQMIVNLNGQWIRTHWASNWYPWRRVYDDSILTNSALLSPLASALGGMPFVNMALDDVLNIRKQGLYLAQGSSGNPICANKPTADDWYYLIAFITHLTTRFLVFAVKSDVSKVYGAVVDNTASSVSWTTLI